MIERRHAWRYEVLMMGGLVLALGVETRLNLTPTEHKLVLFGLMVGFYWLLIQTARTQATTPKLPPEPVRYPMKTLHVGPRRFRVPQARTACLRLYNLPKRKELH